MRRPREDEVWRLPNTVRGADLRLAARGGAAPNALSPAGRARLQRIVARAPEVMVKVTGRARGGAGHLKAHLDYLTRNGSLAIETHEGEVIRDRAGLRALHDDWLLANAVDAKGRTGPTAAQSVAIILSMPEGNPADRVELAAGRWAHETFDGAHDWLMVRHDDRGHPHVHVTVRAVGYDGKRLAPGPEDLQHWRERFAGELRRLGVEAEATPRQARGVVSRRMTSTLLQSERRGAEPRIRKVERQEAAHDTTAPKPPEAAHWSQAVQRRQEAIRAAYLQHAEQLAHGSAEDRRLARDIQRFVADMPVPLTRRQLLAIELRHVLEQRASQIRPDAEGLHRASSAERVHELHAPSDARRKHPYRAPRGTPFSR